VNEKDGLAASFLNIVEFHSSDLMFAVLVFDLYRFANLIDWHSGIVQLSRVQRDVLTQIAAGTVLVFEAEQIILMTVVRHASAEAGKLFEHFRNIFSDLVGRACLLVLEYSRREDTVALGYLRGSLWFAARPLQRIPGDACDNRNRNEAQGDILFVS